ncbi:MAG: hypothetical protein H6581_25475 [Bacteroidia bacterium]|nr:hypothetical protein [Bacteroidia bacterium]
MVNTSKQNVYGIYRRMSMDTHLLAQLGQALGRDFFRDLSESLGPKVEKELRQEDKIRRLSEEIEELKRHLHLPG